MNVKITVAAIALVCAATAGVTASAEAATLGAVVRAADPGWARDAAAPFAGSEKARVWQARHRRHGSRWRGRGHRGGRRHGSGLGFAFTLPFLALALRPHYNVAPPPYAYYPPAPLWRFDGRSWVCDYYDAYSRPLCR